MLTPNEIPVIKKAVVWVIRKCFIRAQYPNSIISNEKLNDDVNSAYCGAGHQEASMGTLILALIQAGGYIREGLLPIPEMVVKKILKPSFIKMWELIPEMWLQRLEEKASSLRNELVLPKKGPHRSLTSLCGSSVLLGMWACSPLSILKWSRNWCIHGYNRQVAKDLQQSHIGSVWPCLSKQRAQL